MLDPLLTKWSPIRQLDFYDIARWSSIPTDLIYSMLFMMNDNEHSCKILYLPNGPL